MYLKSKPGYEWLEEYRPVARVGKSILLYNLPQNGQCNLDSANSR
jgi:hypothetical protein